MMDDLNKEVAAAGLDIAFTETGGYNSWK